MDMTLVSGPLVRAYCCCRSAVVRPGVALLFTGLTLMMLGWSSPGRAQTRGQPRVHLAVGIGLAGEVELQNGFDRDLDPGLAFRAGIERRILPMLSLGGAFQMEPWDPDGPGDGGVASDLMFLPRLHLSIPGGGLHAALGIGVSFDVLDDDFYGWREAEGGAGIVYELMLGGHWPLSGKMQLQAELCFSQREIEHGFDDSSVELDLDLWRTRLALGVSFQI